MNKIKLITNIHHKPFNQTFSRPNFSCTVYNTAKLLHKSLEYYAQKTKTKKTWQLYLNGTRDTTGILHNKVN